MNGSAHKPQENTTVAQAWRLERFKIGFQYTLVLLVSLIVGWLWANASEHPITQEQLSRILGHFDSPLASLPSLREIAPFVLSFAASALLCIAIVFLFSFSALNCLINNGILIYFGVRTGYTVAILRWALMHSETFRLQIGWGRWLLFLLFKLTLMATQWMFCFRASEHSCYLRMYSESGRAILHPKTVLSLCGLTLCSACIVLGLHAFYTWILYIIS